MNEDCEWNDEQEDNYGSILFSQYEDEAEEEYGSILFDDEY